MILAVLFFMAIVVFFGAIAFLIGLYKISFPSDQEDKAFGVKLLTYATICLIIGLGTCSVIPLQGNI